MTQSVHFAIADASQVGEARRAAAHLSAGLGLDDTTRGAVGIVVTELANNLVKHGAGGHVLLRPLEAEAGPDAGVEVLALDKGPGIANVDRALQDGYSTAGSPGTGLGAVRRLSYLCEIYSAPGQGTAILARLRPSSHGRREAPPEVEIGAVNVAVSGETESGDSWAVQLQTGLCRILVADGLGHGVSAAEASREAVRIFRANPQRTPVEALEAAHLALRSTRGAAAALAEIDLQGQEVRYAGVGNISACVLTPSERRNMVSHNGTVGHQVRKIQVFTYPWSYASVLVMHSDGLSTQWGLDAYPGLFARHPGLIAGILYRDFKRGRDDASVVVARGTRS